MTKSLDNTTLTEEQKAQVEQFYSYMGWTDMLKNTTPTEQQEELYNAPESVVISRVNYALDSLKEAVNSLSYIDISELNSAEEIYSKVKTNYDKLIELKTLIEFRIQDLI